VNSHSWALLATVAVLALAAGVVLLIGSPRVAVISARPGHGESALLQKLPLLPAGLLGGAAGAGLGWVFMGPGLSMWIGAGAGVAGALWLVRRAPTETVKQQHLMAREFPLVLNFLALVVESGAPVRVAARVVSQVADGPNAERLRGVLARCDVGFTDAEAWRTLTDDPVWGDVAREMARCVDSGAAVGDVLRSASVQAAKDQAAEATTRARKVGVSSTLPLVACFLPAFLLVGVVPIIGGLISGYIAGW